MKKTIMYTHRDSAPSELKRYSHPKMKRDKKDIQNLHIMMIQIMAS